MILDLLLELLANIALDALMKHGISSQMTGECCECVYACVRVSWNVVGGGV